MITPMTLPRGVADLLSKGMVSEGRLTEVEDHRPDRVLGPTYPDAIMMEMCDNWLSNLSPISVTKGSDYKVLGNTFFEYFRSA